MNSFWGNLYDSFKDRRYAALFLFTIRHPCVLFWGRFCLPVMYFGTCCRDCVVARRLAAFRLARANGGTGCDILPCRVTNCAKPGQSW